VRPYPDGCGPYWIPFVEICTFVRSASAPLTNAGLDIGVVSLDMLLVPQRIDDRRFEERAKRELFRLSPTMPQIRLAPTAPSPQTDRRRFLPCRTPLGPDYEVGSLRHSNIACRLVASGLDADVEPSERHVQ